MFQPITAPFGRNQLKMSLGVAEVKQESSDYRLRVWQTSRIGKIWVKCSKHDQGHCSKRQLSEGKVYERGL